MAIQLMSKEYTFDSMSNIERDVLECFDPIYNAAAIAIPVDENEERVGLIRVRVDWIDG